MYCPGMVNMLLPFFFLLAYTTIFRDMGTRRRCKKKMKKCTCVYLFLVVLGCLKAAAWWPIGYESGLIT